MDIVTITMNPAIDKSVQVNALVPEVKLRCTHMKTEPGGGGINVSKALKRLGKDSLAIFPAGGHNGNMLQDLLREQELNFRTIPVKPETRENFIVLETTSNNQYRFNIASPVLDEMVTGECLALLSNLPFKPAFIVASGSLPEGIHENFYADIAAFSKKKGARFILDSSGTPLRLAANEGVYLLKPNLSELAGLSGVERLSKEDAVNAAQQVIARGHCEVIVVSLGAEGALLVTKEFHEFIAAPAVKKTSTVGAGDSMVAGMVYMLSQNESLSNMARFGVACGSAATMNPGTELFHQQDAQELYSNMSRRPSYHLRILTLLKAKAISPFRLFVFLQVTCNPKNK